MVRTWSTEKVADATCESCGSIYSVEIYRSPAREHGIFKCEICGLLMREWNDTHTPSFTLKKVGIKSI